MAKYLVNSSTWKTLGIHKENKKKSDNSYQNSYVTKCTYPLVIIMII